MDDQRARIAAVFDRSARTYDRVDVDFFSVAGAQLVADIGLRPGDRALDVGCGRGAVLFPAVDAVGPNGVVHGIDLAPTMVELTAAEARERGLANVRTDVMDAQQPQLGAGAYDAVLSSFVVFFLTDPAEGLRTWRTALAPGGRLGLTTFVDRADGRWRWLEELFPDRADDDPGAGDGTDRDDPFASDAALHRLLHAAGYVDARSQQRRHEVTFASPDQWLRWSWSHGMRMYWERLGSQAERDAARAMAVGHLERMRAEPSGLTLAMQVRYTTAAAG